MNIQIKDKKLQTNGFAYWLKSSKRQVWVRLDLVILNYQSYLIISYQLNHMSLTEQSYDFQRLERMYSYPASYQQALIHKNAHKFGYSNPKMKDGKNTSICPCCENYINTVPIPVSYTTIPNTNPSKQDTLYLLPADISLYFTFIKMVIIFVALRFLTVDLYNILTSLSGHYCKSMINLKVQDQGSICSSLNISLLSGYNKHTNQDIFALSNLAYLNLGFTILSLLYLMAYKLFSYKLYDFLQNNDITEDDFTVLVENIPSIIYDKDHSSIEQCHINYEYFLRKTFEGKLQDWVRSIKKKEKNKIKFSRHQQQFYKDVYSKKNDETFDNLPKIHNVTICYDLTQLENLNDKRDQLANQFIKLKGQQDIHLKDSLQFIPNQIKIINSKYIQLCHKFQKDINAASALSKFVGKAFITFEYQHYRAFILRQSDKNHKFITLNNKPLKITQAPKPNDVFWHNMKLSDQQRDKHIYYSYLVMFMALAFFLLSLILLKLFQDKAKQFIKSTKANKKMANFVFNIGMIILTNVFNGVLDSHLNKLTDLQKHQSKTARMSSLIIKNVIAKFVNNVLIYFILFRLNPVNPVSREGLVQKIVSLTTLSAIIKFLLDFIRPNYLFKRLMNFIKYKGEQKINLFQVQLNKSIQNDEFNLASQYCYYIYMTFLVFFYSLLVPIAVPITLILFVMQYWLDKYNLFRRLSSPVDLGYRLVSLILNIFKWNILVLAAGNLYWHLMICSKIHKVSIAIYIINIVIAILAIVLHWLLPKHTEQLILQKLTNKKFYVHSYSYYYKCKKFKKFYDKQNPVTGFLKKSTSENETLNITMKFIQKNKFFEFNIMTLDKVFVDFYQNAIKLQDGASSEASVQSAPDLSYTQKLHLEREFQHLKKN